MDEVTVQFIDFGNIEIVSIANVRYTQLFGDLAAMAHKCSLYNVMPVGFIIQVNS